MKIYIGGDLVPTVSNQKSFEEGRIEDIIGIELNRLLQSSDLNIFNLETPLCDVLHPIFKCGPNLAAPTATVSGIGRIPHLLLGLANNHIMDQGPQGLKTTEQMLKRSKISFLGVGNNLQEARKSFYFEKGNQKIGLYACAEHEFSIATEDVPGANPFDALNTPDHIAAAKTQCDFLIVLYHGGKEYYRYPSLQLQKRCHKMIEKGADLVVCQHSHCIGCREDYKQGVIIYGQGNFVFDQWPKDNEFAHSSLLLELTLGQGNSKVREIPIVRKGTGVTLADDAESTNILRMYQSRSHQILERDFIRQNYEKFADSVRNDYLTAFLGRSILIRGINRLLGHHLADLLLNRSAYVVILNFLECEAHRELLITSIKNKMRGR